MSTVVVVKKNGFAAIAADTLSTFGSLKLSAHYNSQPSKIVRVGESLLGVVGSSAHKLVLEHLFDAAGATPRLSTREEIFDVARMLHPRLKEDYFLNARPDERDPYESSRIVLLIANRHGIFGLYPLRETFEYERFWATGSGGDYALGAMQAVYDNGLDALQIAEAGVRAAIDFDDATGGPIVSEVVRLVLSEVEKPALAPAL